MGDITELLARWQRGDRAAFDDLVPMVYSELRVLAAHYMNQERAEHTLQPTALVHEAYVRLSGARATNFRNRVHFYGAAAHVMRRVLVDHARERDAAKRGDGKKPLPLDAAEHLAVNIREDLVAIDEALSRLATLAERPAAVVQLRYFGGLTVEETAEYLGVAPATVKRDWAFARAWLHRQLGGDPNVTRV